MTTAPTPTTPLLAQINLLETTLQQAWAAGNGDRARTLRAQLAPVWHERRIELAAQARAAHTAYLQAKARRRA